MQLRRQPQKDPGHRGQGARDHPGPADNGFHFDAASPRQGRAFGHRPHRYAGAAVGEINVQPGNNDDCGGQDKNLVWQDADTPPHFDGDLQFVRIGMRSRSESQNNQMAQDQRKTE